MSSARGLPDGVFRATHKRSCDAQGRVPRRESKKTKYWKLTWKLAVILAVVELVITDVFLDSNPGSEMPKLGSLLKTMAKRRSPLGSQEKLNQQIFRYL